MAKGKRADVQYINAHRFIYGDIGEHVATAALLFRDKLMLPGFVLPAIRLAPVAPYGRCLGLSGNGDSLKHVQGMENGIWVYLHQKWYDTGESLLDKADEVVLHELIHNELMQFQKNPKHDGTPWAERCQEISTRLELGVKIEAKKSIRRGRQVFKDVPEGCLPYQELARWPADLLSSGPTLRERLA